MSRYLVELADVLRAAGLTVIEFEDWQTRARSSGGYQDGRPWCVMLHHTASTASAAGDASYCAEGSPDAPICNLLVGDLGEIHLIAAGATNTNGKGYSMAFSRGTVPDDSMNTYAVGIELCNSGTGETYPAVQIDAALAASLAICGAYGLEPTDVAQHVDWAPDRKIDPATATAVQGSWRPRSINSSGSWALDDLRAELAARAGMPVPPLPGPTPEPGPPAAPIGEDEMSMVVALDKNGTAWVGDGMTRRPIADESEFNVKVLLANEGCFRFVNTSGEGVAGWHNVYEVDDNVIAALGRSS